MTLWSEVSGPTLEIDRRLDLKQKEAELEQVNIKLLTLSSRLAESTNEFNDQRKEVASQTAELDSQESAHKAAVQANKTDIKGVVERAESAKTEARRCEEEVRWLSPLAATKRLRIIHASR